MKENRFLYKFLKMIYSSIIKVLYNPKVIGKENIPDNRCSYFCGKSQACI